MKIVISHSKSSDQQGAEQADHNRRNQGDFEVLHLHAQRQLADQQEDEGPDRPLQQPEQGVHRNRGSVMVSGGTINTVSQLNNGARPPLPQTARLP